MCYNKTTNEIGGLNMVKKIWQDGELITADGLNSIEDKIEKSSQIDNIFGSSKIDIDDPKISLTDGYRTLVLSSNEAVVTDFFDIPLGSVVSASLNRTHISGGGSPSGGGTWGIQFYKDGAFLQSIYSTKSKDSEKAYDKLENKSNASANQVRFRFFPDSGIMKINQLMINVGEIALPFSLGSDNLANNPNFEDGLSGYYSNAGATLPLSKNVNFIETEKNNYNYLIETPENILGTLPGEILNGSLYASRISIQGSSENGLGGTTVTIYTNDKTYQKKYTYEWGDWNIVYGVYGSFDSAGVWHTLNGNILNGGIAYNGNDGYFYALAEDGTIYKTTGWQTLPIGRNKSDLTVKLLGDGRIDPDITSSDVVSSYVQSVNNYISNSGTKTSVHVVVSDTHGIDYNNLMRSTNRLLTGTQYKTSWYTDIYPIASYVTQKDYDELSGVYFRSIARLNAVNAPKNINSISARYSKPVNVFSHLGDIEDGLNGTALEEKRSYDVVAKPYTDFNFNIIDGNHDEQPVCYERLVLLNGLGVGIENPVHGYNRTRRVDSQRWKDSYGKDYSYYSISDDDNKVKYIYLDSFEGGKLKLKTGTSPDYGEYIKGGKLTDNQIKWFISELENTSNEYSVVINIHHIPYSNLLGKQPTKDTNDWWRGNVNPDILTGILKAFQQSTSYTGSSSFTSDMNAYDMTPYNSAVSVDFGGKTANRIAVINYGHYHTYGHTSKTDNGLFNLVQHPNLCAPGWSYVGDVRGQQFTTELIDTTNRTVTVIRFSPTDTNDEKFTMSY